VASSVNEILRELPGVVALAGAAERQRLALGLTACLATLAAGMATAIEETERASVEVAREAEAAKEAAGLVTPEAALVALGLEVTPERRRWLMSATRHQPFRVKLSSRTVLFNVAGLSKWFAGKRRIDAARMEMQA